MRGRPPRPHPPQPRPSLRRTNLSGSAAGPATSCPNASGASSPPCPPASRTRFSPLSTGSAFARANIADPSEKTHIWDIISESITVFDEKRMEEITRSVANRELLWVTLLGGVIGAVVGVVQSIALYVFERFC